MRDLLHITHHEGERVMTTEPTTVMLPAMRGFVFRHFEGDADYEGMARVSAALSDADHLEFYPTAEWLKISWRT